MISQFKNVLEVSFIYIYFSSFSSNKSCIYFAYSIIQEELKMHEHDHVKMAHLVLRVRALKMQVIPGFCTNIIAIFFFKSYQKIYIF